MGEFEIRVISNWILNFEIISKWSFTTLHSCLQMVITSSFQLWFVHRLKRWTPDFLIFKMIYSVPKMNFRNYSKFFLKLRVHVATKFWVPNFHAVESCFMPHFPCFVAFFLLHNGHFSYLKLMISSSCLFSWFMSYDSLIFLFSPFLIFQNLKWFNLHPFLSLNMR